MAKSYGYFAHIMVMYLSIAQTIRVHFSGETLLPLTQSSNFFLHYIFVSNIRVEYSCRSKFASTYFRWPYCDTYLSVLRGLNEHKIASEQSDMEEGTRMIKMRLNESK